MEIPLDKWTVSHDSEKKWGVLTTNFSESFNGVLKKARGFSVTAMVKLSVELLSDTLKGLKKRNNFYNKINCGPKGSK